MAKYHINGIGDPGLCKALIQCPFGDADAHYDTPEAARASYEESSETFNFRPNSRASLAKLELSTQVFESDYFSLTLQDEGRPVTTMNFRILPDNRIWPQWRENHYNPEFPAPPKGAHDELQRRVLSLLPGWTMTSHPGEISPAGEVFRESFLARNPDYRWDLDWELESDSGMDEFTPRLDKNVAEDLIANTPLATIVANQKA